MNFSFFCILVAAVLPLVWAGYAKFSGGFKMGDNASPRTYMEKLQGASQRANWAQQNSWEAFAPFAAAVIMANISKADPDRISLYAGTFIVARLLYGIFYISDQSTFRSLVWFLGMAATFGLFYLSLAA
jgi:uncharacterized MAPEG superfamily protein